MSDFEKKIVDRFKKISGTIEKFLEDKQVVEKGKDALTKGVEKAKELYEKKEVQEAIEKGKKITENIAAKAKEKYNSENVQAAVEMTKKTAEIFAKKVSEKYDAFHEKIKTSATTGSEPAKIYLQAEDIAKGAVDKATDFYKSMKKSLRTETYDSLIPGYYDVIETLKKESKNEAHKKYTLNLENNVEMIVEQELENGSLSITTLRTNSENETHFLIVTKQGYDPSEMERTFTNLAKDAYETVNDKDMKFLKKEPVLRDIMISTGQDMTTKYTASAELNDSCLELKYIPKDLDKPHMNIIKISGR